MVSGVRCPGTEHVRLDVHEIGSKSVGTSPFLNHCFVPLKAPSKRIPNLAHSTPDPYLISES